MGCVPVYMTHLGCTPSPMCLPLRVVYTYKSTAYIPPWEYVAIIIILLEEYEIRNCMCFFSSSFTVLTGINYLLHAYTY